MDGTVTITIWFDWRVGTRIAWENRTLGNKRPWRSRGLFSQGGGSFILALVIGLMEWLRAVASIGAQNLYSEHPAFLTDGTGGEVDPADSE